MKSDKKVPPKVQKKGSIGYNKKSALLEDAITQMNAGKYGRASSALKDLLALDPLNAEARRLFATLHLRLGSLMSARTAFESLAREAMERQDYWLAESLLREYLTAGPRYVPFLEMLGRVYEEKGDVMAAVAEYGKAVEVLLEDPDSEKPNHASDLFVRIRSIAPGSPVAFRFAAMFDTVTGQVLQAAPQPAISGPEYESLQAAVVPGSVGDGAVPMPWEQVEPLPADAPIAQVSSGSAIAPPTEVMESVSPPALPVETGATVGQQDALVGQSPASSTWGARLETQAPADPSLPPVASVEAPASTLTQQEPPVVDLLPASASETASSAPSAPSEPQPAIAMLTEAGAHPIAQAPSSPAPMPWDQVEEAAVVIPPASVNHGSTASEEVPSVSFEPEPVSTPEVEAGRPTIEVLAESGSHPIAQAPSSPAPMPWDQVEEVAVVILSTPASQTPQVLEPEALPSLEAELPPAPVSEPALPTIEVLSQIDSHATIEAPASPVSLSRDGVEESSVLIPPPTDPSASSMTAGAPDSSREEARSSPATEAEVPTIEVLTQATNHPIAEPPASPAPMPWDQIQEATSDGPQHTEITAEGDLVENDLAIEAHNRAQELKAGEATEPHPASSRSEITSSGLSWEEILAAVAAMQSSPAPAQTLPNAEADLLPDRIGTDEPTPAFTAALDPVEMESTLYDAPASVSPIDQDSASAALSAPMPWEQIEVDDLTIPRHEPEPEFGPISVELPSGVQDATLILPVQSHMIESVAPTETLAVSTADVPAEAAVESTPSFRLLSPDAANESRNASIHIPVVVHEPSAEQITETLSEFSAVLVKQEDAAVPLRLAESESVLPVATGEPIAVQAEPVTEFTIAGTRDEPVATLSPEPILEIERSEEIMPAQATLTSLNLETMAETVVASPSPFPIEDQAGVEAEPVVPVPQDAVTVDSPAMPTPKCSAVVEQEPITTPVAQEVSGFPSGEAINSPVEVSLASANSVQEHPSGSSAAELMAASAEESLQFLAEPAQDAEPVQPEQALEVTAEPPAIDPQLLGQTTPAPSEHAVGDGLRILWEDTSAAPTPKPSTGNMLTRWLKKPAETVSPEIPAAGVSTTAPAEPVASISPLPVEEVVPAAVVMEQPPEQHVDQAAPVITQEPASRLKPIQPIAAGVWSRVGGMAASLVGAGVSTTRSLVVLVLALVGLALFLVGGTVGVVALTWLVLEEQPSAAYRNMTSVPQQMLQDPSKNGYFLLLGFGAAASQDPMQTGMDRRVEGADQAFTHTCLTGEGYTPSGDQHASAEAAGQWMKTADPASQMHLDANGVKTWASQAEVSLGRYRQWLNKPFEDVGFGQPLSPNCGLILHTHRLYVADGFVQDVETGIARLETDLTAWRTVFGQAKTLPVKMLASAAMNDDIAVMGGLFQRPDLEERFVSRLAKLARPLEQTEQSLRWPMQSQFVLATKTLDEAISQDRVGTRPFYGAIAAVLPLPKQRRFNAYAQYYEEAGKAASEGRYADLPKQSQFVHAPPYGVSDMVLNPIESLVGVNPLPAWETYAGRVLETDARLRLASLQAWLRRTPPEQDLLTRLAKAGQGLYDPFTGLPMLVNMKKGLLYSVGPDLKDNEAYAHLDLVAQIPPVSWAGGKKPVDTGKTK